MTPVSFLKNLVPEKKIDPTTYLVTRALLPAKHAGYAAHDGASEAALRVRCRALILAAVVV